VSEDLVIAGGGPTGLMLACEVSMAGRRPLVLERLPEITERNRANGLVGQVVRLLDHRGLYQRITGTAEPPQPVPYFYFGAMQMQLQDLPDNPLYTLPVPQRRVEEVLEQRATELGVQIRRGHELTGLSQDPDGVDIQVAAPDGAFRLRARYLVGADGGHSLTRKLAGIGFPGVTRDDTVSRFAYVTVPADVVDPSTGGLNVPGYGPIPPFQLHRTERGIFGYAPFPGRPARVFTREWEPGTTLDQPMTLAELQDSVRRVLGVGLPLAEPTGEGPYVPLRRTSDNTRLAERYRNGRVLLVGDAAHVHSAIGGPGLNLGLQDAANLGWKLAAVLRGSARAELLDTYDSERRQSGLRVIMYSQAQRVLMSPGPAVTALRELFGEFLAEAANRRRIAAMMAGSDIRYDMGPDPHPLCGYFLRDFSVSTESGRTRLAELARSARPLLLNLTGNPAFVETATGWKDRVDLITAQADVSAAALLIRPDGYVAWAADTAEPHGLRAALTRWFGDARDLTPTLSVARRPRRPLHDRI
jgi:2-polyprenyl-6-methoxyphenol hydroxylase-like FAD-dependent oxidoreductase